MKVGTKSVLFGAHCFLIHWIFVAWGWLRIYGTRRVYIGPKRVRAPRGLPSIRGAQWTRPEYASIWRPALWLAFLVHDIGYLGKPNMDGAEGEQHPRLGAAIMRRIFGEPWGQFVLYHSRFLAKQDGAAPTPLCIADKLAIALEPAWLYLPMVTLTGEVNEYMAKSDEMNATGDAFKLDRDWNAKRRWHAAMVKYILAWIAAHKDGQEDTWTLARRSAGPVGAAAR